MPNPTERVAIFIDVSNFYHGLKEFRGNANVNLELFCNYLLNGRRLTRIYYYNAPKILKENPSGYATNVVIPFSQISYKDHLPFS